MDKDYRFDKFMQRLFSMLAVVMANLTTLSFVARIYYDKPNGYYLGFWYALFMGYFCWKASLYD